MISPVALSIPANITSTSPSTCKIRARSADASYGAQRPRLKLAIRMRKVALATSGVAPRRSHRQSRCRQGRCRAHRQLLDSAVSDQHTFGKMLGGDLCDRLHHGRLSPLGKKNNAQRQPLAQGSASGPWQLLHLSAVRSDKLADGLHDHDLANRNLGTSSFSIMEVRAIIFLGPCPGSQTLSRGSHRRHSCRWTWRNRRSAE